jgi:hypothetical protein
MRSQGECGAINLACGMWLMWCASFLLCSCRLGQPSQCGEVPLCCVNASAGARWVGVMHVSVRGT